MYVNYGLQISAWIYQSMLYKYSRAYTVTKMYFHAIEVDNIPLDVSG